MDAVTKSLIKVIGDSGYDILIGHNTFEAIDQNTGERFIIRCPNLYDGSIELAQQVGIELELAEIGFSNYLCALDSMLSLELDQNQRSDQWGYIHS